MNPYIPLYPPEGGAPAAYQCRQCLTPKRTKKGIISHLWQKHKVRIQLVLDFEATEPKVEGQNEASLSVQP